MTIMSRGKIKKCTMKMRQQKEEETKDKEDECQALLMQLEAGQGTTECFKLLLM